MENNEALQPLAFTVSGFISRPVDEVYEAVANPEQLSRYFTTGGARGRLESGTEVTWDFHDFPGEFSVQVIEARKPERIEIAWEGREVTSQDGKNRVVFAFEPVDGGTRTKVEISESAWKATNQGAEAAFGNCMGWTGMLAAMKAWVEHGINLRDGFYK